MRVIQCLTVFFLCASVAAAENELFTLTLVTHDGRLPQRTRGLFARQLPGVDIKSNTAIARYRQSPVLPEANCLHMAYYLHDAANALIGRGCFSDADLAEAIFSIRTAMKRNQAVYSRNDRDPVALLDQALGAAAASNYAYAAAILDRLEMRNLPADEQAIARRLRGVVSR